MKTMKPVAYENGRTGDIVHATCWGDYVDARRNYDAQGRPMPYGMLGTLHYDGSKQLKGKACAHCAKSLL